MKISNFKPHPNWDKKKYPEIGTVDVHYLWGLFKSTEEVIWINGYWYFANYSGPIHQEQNMINKLVKLFLEKEKLNATK